MKKTFTRWAIVGRWNDGLYTGQWQARRDAIREHAAALEGPWPNANRGKLTSDERKAWQKCFRRGDRAIKVTITYEAP